MKICSFIQVSDTNAELVRLGNQVALLEEEKGNLQLSLVDFDELKGRNQDRNSVIAVSIVLVSLSIVYAMHCPFILFSKQLSAALFSLLRKNSNVYSYNIYMYISRICIRT